MYLVQQKPAFGRKQKRLCQEVSREGFQPGDMDLGLPPPLFSGRVELGGAHNNYEKIGGGGFLAAAGGAWPPGTPYFAGILAGGGGLPQLHIPWFLLGWLLNVQVFVSRGKPGEFDPGNTASVR